MADFKKDLADILNEVNQKGATDSDYDLLFYRTLININYLQYRYNQGNFLSIKIISRLPSIFRYHGQVAANHECSTCKKWNNETAIFHEKLFKYTKEVYYDSCDDHGYDDFNKNCHSHTYVKTCSEDPIELTLKQCGYCNSFFEQCFVTTNVNGYDTCYTCATYNALTCIVCGMRAGINVRDEQLRICYHTSCINLIKSKTKCPFCNVNIKDGQKICNKCEKFIIFDYNYKPEPSFKFIKEHKSKVPYFGVEIETEIKPHLRNKILKKDVGFRLLEQVNGVVKREDTRDLIYLKRDSSIGVITKNYRGEAALEIVTNPITFDYWASDNMNPLWNGLSKLARVATSYNTGNCGIHVHISRSAFINPKHQAAFGWFIEKRLYLTSIISERFQNDYCLLNLNPYGDIYKGVSFTSPEHHTMVNYTKQTIEIRSFKGNLKKERILKDIQYIDAVFEWTKEFFSPKSDDNLPFADFQAALTISSFEEFINSNEKYKELSTYLNLHLNKLFINEPVSLRKKEATFANLLDDKDFWNYISKNGDNATNAFKKGVSDSFGLTLECYRLYLEDTVDHTAIRKLVLEIFEKYLESKEKPKANTFLFQQNESLQSLVEGFMAENYSAGTGWTEVSGVVNLPPAYIEPAVAQPGPPAGVPVGTVVDYFNFEEEAINTFNEDDD